MPLKALAALELEYANLPESIKLIYSFQEYAWMGAERRARLLQDETESEYEEP
jgi:hypothetical protein